MKIDWKGLVWKCFRFILALTWNIFLTCVWACLRAIELLSRMLGDWIKSLITPNDRRPNDPHRKTF